MLQNKDLYLPSVRGVGFIGEGVYRASISGVETEAYKSWARMLTRCYSAYTHPAYAGCTVCEEWHNFQNFAKWHEDNYIKGYHLDKDTKVVGNKMYSPDTCQFICGKRNVSAATSKKITLKHTDGTVISASSQTKAAESANISRGSVSRLVSGQYSEIKGWSIISKE